MQTFLNDLMAHAEWANAVFFRAWSKSPARDHEELRSRVGHLIGVQQGFLSILRGEAPGSPPDGPPPSFESLESRAQTCHAGLREFAAALRPEDLAPTVRNPVVSGPAVCGHGRRGTGAGCNAQPASPRPVYDPAQGFRR